MLWLIVVARLIISNILQGCLNAPFLGTVRWMVWKNQAISLVPILNLGLCPGQVCSVDPAVIIPLVMCLVPCGPNKYKMGSSKFAKDSFGGMTFKYIKTYKCDGRALHSSTIGAIVWQSSYERVAICPPYELLIKHKNRE